MAVGITFKRTGTFKRRVRITLEDGSPQDITGWTISSQIKTTAYAAVSTLTVSDRVDASGQFVLTDTSTSDWPLGLLHWDIKLTDADSVVRHTQTVTIKVEREVTA